jgi:drug/metabolite transporter (DMT)-like permease
MKEEHDPHASFGVAMGAGSVLLWSLSSACIVFAGKRVGVWQFLALTALSGGLLQMLGYLAMGRRLRSLVLPPPKLWLAIALGFVAYLLLYTTALVSARTEAQAVGVSLMNYLWPTLTILFTTWLVPGERMRPRLAFSILLSFGGVLLANGRDIAWPGTGVSVWPYLLGGAAAASWAAYCALTSRWRRWAKDYATAPMGFLLVGTVAAGVCLWHGEWQPMDGRAWSVVLLTATGPWAIGYMLWEMALHRASAITLGLLGSATPVLSTLCMLGVFAVTSATPVSGARVAVLLAAAVMIGVAVAVGRTTGGK